MSNLNGLRVHLPTLTDKECELDTFAHYSNPSFADGQTETIFGSLEEARKHKGVFYVYSDRLLEWDFNKYNSAFNAADANTELTKFSCAYYECVLSHYEGQRVAIHHILKGVNVSNGFPYLIFGFTRNNEESANEQKSQES